MAQTSFPFENIDTTETQYSRLVRNFQDYGIKGIPGDNNLKVTTPGDSMTISVSSGQAFVRGHYYISSSAESITILSAGTKTRIDAIVLELDPVGNSVLLKVVRGTEVDSTPSAPSLTQLDAGVYQMALAYLTIPANTTVLNSSMIEDVRTFMGQRIGIWTSTTRPASPVSNQTFGYNVTIGYHEVWNGSDWIPFKPDQPTPFLLMGA
jgi:hypothetical protein